MCSFRSVLSLGCMMSVTLLCTGSKASATVQPFLLLHLDILPGSVQTIEDALHLFSAPENLEGYRTSPGKVSTCYEINIIHY